MPRELWLFWQHRRYGVLPSAGGLEDQEPGLLDRMSIMGDAYDAYNDYRSIPAGGGADWQRRNPHKWRIVCEIEGW